VRSVGRYFCCEIEDKPWYSGADIWILSSQVASTASTSVMDSSMTFPEELREITSISSTRIYSKSLATQTFEFFNSSLLMERSSQHLMLGFSGGRKLVAPGVAG
jgi:hypothetical protein